MNKLPVYLYSNRISVISDLDQIEGIYKVMYQRKVKIQKGFKDSIRIQFMNSDQKPLWLSTTTNYWFDMIDSTGRELVLSKPLILVDDAVTTSTKGIALATFDPIDTINVTAGSYKFVVKKENEDGTFSPAYANTYYGITGEVEVVEDGYPLGYPVQTVTLAQLESSKQYDRTFGAMGYEFVTGWLRPKIRSTTTSTVSSAVFSLSRFTGEITVEGTLDNDPSPQGQANAQVFTITNHVTVSPTHGTIELTWNTQASAVRFKVKPKNDNLGVNYYPTGNPIGTNTNKFPSGFVDQIQYIS